ncbi:MAG: hypothetical protein JG774_1099 [Desulfomicrobiaceae bacterium]|jgi:hypothetical protein|nr:hypothetical protein [Desulfomicrobiaceae bacterium]MBZ4685354.1 hypothetical protein [Desulfomicrobiaceae bacterium]MDK2873098.1 hypothetical protein [Desulfomicrobiaceae bacterium]
MFVKPKLCPSCLVSVGRCTVCGGRGLSAFAAIWGGVSLAVRPVLWGGAGGSTRPTFFPKKQTPIWRT